MSETQSNYNYKVVRQFAVMAVIWGIVGMSVGVFIAAQLVWPDLTFGIEWLSYGRLRPLHTNAVIRLRRQRTVCHVVLVRAAYPPYAPVRRPARRFTFWGGSW